MNLDGIIEDLPNKSTPLCKTTFEKMCNAILNNVYPIGMSIIFRDNEDHSNFLGLKWERDLVGLTPVGCNATGSNVSTKMGAETHRHIGSNFSATINGETYVGIDNNYNKSVAIDNSNIKSFVGNKPDIMYAASGTNAHSYYTQAESSYQPSEVVAFWKRVA